MYTYHILRLSLIISIGCHLENNSIGMDKTNVPGARPSAQKLANFYAFMPTSGDKIPKTSANRITPHRQDGASCKTTSNSEDAMRMALPTRPARKSTSRVRRRYPFSRQGRKLSQGALSKSLPRVKSKDKSSDGIEIEVSSFADQQNQPTTSENSTTETLSYSKKPETDLSFVTRDDSCDDKTADKFVTQNKRYKSESSKNDFFLLEKVLIDDGNKGRTVLRPPSARSVYIDAMNKLKLTPKPTSIIAKYKEERICLSLGHVGYGDNHAYAIAKSASFLPDVHSIYFNNNNLSPRLSYKISNCVSPWIVTLDVSNNNLRSTGSKELGRSFKNACNLERLYMKNNNISDDGGATLLEYLINLQRLRILDLSENCLGTKCSKAIRTMLKTSIALTHLFLRWNRFFKDDMQTLGEGLSQNETLVSLDLAFNALSKCNLLLKDIASEVVDYFFHSISRHASLRHLDLE